MISKIQSVTSILTILTLLLGHLAAPLQAVAAARPAPTIDQRLPGPSLPQSVALLAQRQPKPAVMVTGPQKPAAWQSAIPAAVGTAAVTPTLSIVLSPIGNYPVTAGTAEIVTYDPVSQTLYASNATSNTITILDISNPTNPVPTAGSPIDMSPYGGETTSVDFYPASGLLAAAVAAPTPTDPGTVAVFQRDGSLVFTRTVGALPDMVTFTPDGQKILTANEGEPDSGIDPEGSVSIVSNLAATPVVSTASFVPFNAISQTLISNGVRIIGPDANVAATVAQDLEPEYIAVSPDSMTAYVTLQENNALAVVDIAASTVMTVAALGYKDHSLAANAFDTSDRDDTDDLDDQVFSGTTITDTDTVRGEINLRSWANVVGMYQPDTIASFQSGGMTYLVTANEGDARGFEEERVEDLNLDPSFFVSDPTITDTAKLGRLEVTNASGDTDGDNDIDVIHAFGARSFSIWDSNGNLVYDSGSDIEQITAAFDPTRFNGDNGSDELDTVDSRSDAKGPEPEGVAVGDAFGRTYAFIGLERVGGILVYDVTIPASPTFVQYVNSVYKYGSLGPEGMKFISATDSPTANPLLAVSYEGSNSVVIFEITQNPDGAGTLTLLHNNDGESALLSRDASVPAGSIFGNAGDVSVSVGNVGAFKTVTKNQIDDARQRGHAVLNVYAGDAYLASTELSCTQDDPNGPFYDGVAQKQIGYDAHILGNHEFDFGPAFLRRFIDSFKINGVLQQPFLSSTLDFSASPDLNPLRATNDLYEGYTIDGNVLASSAIIVDEVTGQRFGLVSALYWAIDSISSPAPVVSKTSDLTSTATIVQGEVDRLTAKGVNKIILVNHLQNNDTDAALIGLLRDVDVVVGGGGDELLVNQSLPNPALNQVLPGEVEPIAGDYPRQTQDANGNTVYLVTGVGQYKYVGRLDVTFDASGQVTGFMDNTSYPRRVIPSDSTNANILTDLPSLVAADIAAIDSNVQEDVLEPIQNCVSALDQPLVGLEVELDARRASVRTKETNAGNAIADSYLWVYDEYAAQNGLTPSGPSNPVVAIQNGGGIRLDGFLPTDRMVPGTMSRKDTRDNLPFGNRITVITDVTPSDLKAIFERSISGWPSAEGRHMQAAGLEVIFDGEGTAQVVQGDGTVTTAGARVKSISLADGTAIVRNGLVVSGAPNVTLITNKFTAANPPAGGDTYPWLFNNPNKLLEMVDNNGLIFDYEQAWVRYLLQSGDFPTKTIGAFTGPTIPMTDTRYADIEGEGRLVVTTKKPLEVLHLAPFALDLASSSEDVSAQSSGVNLELSSAVRTDTASGLKYGNSQQLDGAATLSNTLTITPEVIPGLRQSLVVTLTEDVTPTVVLIGDNLKAYSPLQGLTLTGTTTALGPGQGAFRVVHAAPFGSTNANADIDVLDSSGSSVAGFPVNGVAYGTVTPFFIVATGTYTISVSPAGGSPVLQPSFTLADGDVKTLYVAGNGSNQALQVVSASGSGTDIYLPIISKDNSN